MKLVRLTRPDHPKSEELPSSSRRRLPTSKAPIPTYIHSQHRSRSSLRIIWWPVARMRTQIYAELCPSTDRMHLYFVISAQPRRRVRCVVTYRYPEDNSRYKLDLPTFTRTPSVPESFLLYELRVGKGARGYQRSYTNWPKDQYLPLQ